MYDIRHCYTFLLKSIARVVESNKTFVLVKTFITLHILLSTQNYSVVVRALLLYCFIYFYRVDIKMWSVVYLQGGGRH